MKKKKNKRWFQNLSKRKIVIASITIGILVIAILTFSTALSSRFNVEAYSPTPPEDWVRNPEVDLVGRGIIRAIDFADWSLGLREEAKGNISDTTKNTLYTIWKIIFELSLLIYTIFLIIIAYGYILKAPWLDRWKRYIPWLTLALIGSAASFFITVTIIKFFGLAMGAILSKITSASNFINVEIDYKTFIGKSDPDPSAIEGIKNTLILTKIATFSLYALGIVLTARMIFLWLLTVISPLILPLFTFEKTRSLGIMWLREFARWLIIGLLFAIFLFFVSYWSSVTSLNSQASDRAEYFSSTTTINLKPPSGSNAPSISKGTGNEKGLNTFTSYSMFIVSLILLWLAILAPWFLTQFALNATSGAVNNWVAKNENNRFASILKQFFKTQENKPAMPATQSPAIASQTRKSSKKFNIQEALKLRVADNKITPDKQESSLSPQSILSAHTSELSGLDKFTSIQNSLKDAGKHNSKLTTLSNIETDTTNTPQALQAIELLQKPDKINDPNLQTTIKQVRNNIELHEETQPDKTTKITSVLKNDVSSIANQEPVDDIYEELYKNAKQEIKNLLSSPQPLDEDKLNDIQNISNLLEEYHQTDKAKLGSRDQIAQQITLLSNKIVASPQSIPSPDNTQSIDRHNIQNIIDQTDKYFILPESDSKEELGKEIAKKINQQLALPTTAQPVQPLLIQLAKELEKKPLNNASSDNVSKISSALKQNIKIPEGTISPSDNLNNQSLKLLAKYSTGYINKQSKANKNLFDQVKKQLPNINNSRDHQSAYQNWVKTYQSESNSDLLSSTSTNQKKEWLKKEIDKYQNVLSELNNPDVDIRQQGLKKLDNILPFLLIGNYSLSDIIQYLEIKVAAAQTVLNEPGKFVNESSTLNTK